MTFPAAFYYFGEPVYVEPMLNSGEISFGVSAQFIRPELTIAQRDDEQRRKFIAAKVQVAVGAGDTIAPLQSVTSAKITLGIKNPYYLKSFALTYDSEHYKRFPGGACIHYKNISELMTRFDVALKSQLPEWGALAARVQYADFSRLPPSSTQIDLMFLKDTSEYADQGEYRIVLVPPAGHAAQDRRSIFLGDMSDIAEIVEPG